MSKQEAFPPFPEESELDEANEPHENLKIVERDLQRISEWREKTKKTLREKITDIESYNDYCGSWVADELRKILKALK